MLSQLVNNYQRNVSAAGERGKSCDVILFLVCMVGNEEGAR